MATQARTSTVPEDYEPPRRVSPEEYCQLDDASEVRYEYSDGCMYPRFYPPGSHWSMAGGTRAHGALTMALQGRLRSHVRPPCFVYNQDTRLAIDAQHYAYPDTFVLCGGPRDPEGHTEHDALLVCEVLSPSTEADDQGRKRLAYQRLAGIQEYLLLDSRRIAATLYRRTPDGWLVHDLAEGDVLELASINLAFPLSGLYAEAGIEWAAPAGG